MIGTTASLIDERGTCVSAAGAGCAVTEPR
jgi:hypothetical protein